MKKTILTILCVLFGLMMVNSGLNKFLNYMPMPKMSEEMMSVFGALMTVKWIMPLVAIVEIIGGILVAIPKTRALGAIVIFPIMVGIVIHHISYNDFQGLMVGLVLFIINLLIIVDNKDRYMHMIK